MQVLYETPNNRYKIVIQNDLWSEVFGVPVYIICGVTRMTPKDSNDISHYFITRTEGTIIECLSWLRKRNIISKDEYLFQVEKLVENSSSKTLDR